MANSAPLMSPVMIRRMAARPAFWWWVGITAAVLAGVWIRVMMGVDPPGIWADESAWFGRFRRLEDVHLSIRAPAYLWLHKVLFQDLFSTYTEFRIRIVSIVSGVLFLPLFTLVVHRLFRRPWVTLVGALLASFNIGLASYTHEFKPYMVDLFLHTAWFYVAVLVDDKRLAAVGGAAVLVVACLFSYSAVPLLGFQFVYVLYLRAKGLIGGAAFAASVLIVVFTIDAFLFAYVVKFAESNPPDYWAEKYGVFFNAPFEIRTFVPWFLEKLSTYLTFPLNLFSEPERMDDERGFQGGFGFVQHAALGVLFCGLAVASWLKHRWDDPRLIPVYLLGGYTTAGILQIWPLGFFRTNLFLFLYGTLAMLGYLAACTGRLRAVAAMALLAPFAVFTLSNPIGEKINHLRTAQYLEAVCDTDTRKTIPIAADPNAASSARFYLRYDATVKRRCGARAAVRPFENLRALRALLRSDPPHGSGIWVLVQGTATMHRDRIRQWLYGRYDVRVDAASRRMYLLNVRSKPAVGKTGVQAPVIVQPAR